ncbi:hypothetical protein RB653_002161 [Dictyostelium firmibasis]|uniref:Uncharacterized protein n=1 Tax=Dictyostelium firmibasis TaxID=79012 RepID=A0AAN7YSE2_9MYCE
MKLLITLIILINLIIVKSNLVIKTNVYNSPGCTGGVNKTVLHSSCNIVFRHELVGMNISYYYPNEKMTSTCSNAQTKYFEEQINVCDEDNQIKVAHTYTKYQDAIDDLPMNTCNEVIFNGGCEENYLITSVLKGTCSPIKINDTDAWTYSSCDENTMLSYVCSEPSCFIGNCYALPNVYKNSTQCVPGRDVDGNIVDGIYYKFVPKLIKPTPSSVPSISPIPNQDEQPSHSSKLFASFALIILGLLSSL